MGESISISDAYERIRQRFYPEVDGVDFHRSNPGEIFRKLCETAGFITSENKPSLPDNFLRTPTSRLYKNVYISLLFELTGNTRRGRNRQPVNYVDTLPLDKLLEALETALADKKPSFESIIPQAPAAPVKDPREDLKVAFCKGLNIDPASTEKPFFKLFREVLTATGFAFKLGKIHLKSAEQMQGQGKSLAVLIFNSAKDAGHDDIKKQHLSSMLSAILNEAPTARPIDPSLIEICGQVIAANRKNALEQYKHTLTDQNKRHKGL